MVSGHIKYDDVHNGLYFAPADFFLCATWSQWDYWEDCRPKAYFQHQYLTMDDGQSWHTPEIDYGREAKTNLGSQR